MTRTTDFLRGCLDSRNMLPEQSQTETAFTTNFTNNNIELKMIDGIPYVKLPKIGNIRFILPKGKILADIQPHGVSIKAATVSREPDGSYRIALRMESVIDKPVFPTVHQRQGDNLC